MANKIQYGPHLFSEAPEMYIRTDDSITNYMAHKNIKHTLGAAFCNEYESSFLNILPDELGFNLDSEINISFMNYGNTQMVYLVTLDEDKKFAVLINQPHTDYGVVKKELHNLQRLFEIDDRFVVKTHGYFGDYYCKQELYISEYVDNAMCIAVQKKHGVYDPLPSYHFDNFNADISSEVNKSMIALLVNYYDEERGRGISKTQISGDDFILSRGFNKKNKETILPNMKIIAARDFIDISLDDYLGKLQEEFLIGTNREDPLVENGSILINTRSKLPMTSEDIYSGIDLGLDLRAERGV